MRHRTFAVPGISSLLLTAVLLAIGTCDSEAEPRAVQMPPLTVDQLQRNPPIGSQLSQAPYAGGEQYRGLLVSYRHRGLLLRALIALPRHRMPAGGYPAIIANHGYHPRPREYGVRANGENRRPGDYYSEIPEAFAAAGYAVVMADYRGHSDSEGIAAKPLSLLYYAEDVLALLPLLNQVSQLDTRNLFLWGHSMGGAVSLRMLLARPQVRAASLWSTMGGSLWEQAHYYSTEDESAPLEEKESELVGVEALREAIDGFSGTWQWQHSDSISHLQVVEVPMILHHAREDRSTLYDWSRQLAANLYRLQKPYRLFSYPGADHLFKDEQFDRAIARDLAFFAQYQARSAKVSTEDASAPSSLRLRAGNGR